MSERIYLARPEVFLAMSREIGARERAICARYGLVGIYPADERHAPDPACPLPEQGIAITHAANVGSACEMGYMRALGCPMFAYSNATRPFVDRVAAFCGDSERDCRPHGHACRRRLAPRPPRPVPLDTLIATHAVHAGRALLALS